MTRFSGNLSNMVRKNHRRAILYRELRTNRNAYGVVLLALLGPYIFDLLVTSPGQVSNYVGSYIGGFSLAYFDVVVAGVLGIAVMWHDRIRDQMADVLEGPVSRRDFILAKIQWSAATVTAAGVGMALLLMIVCLTIGGFGEFGLVLVRDAWQTAAEMAMALTALAMSTAMGSTLFAAAGSAIWPVIPLVAGEIFSVVYFNPVYAKPLGGRLPGSAAAVQWGNNTVSAIQHVSPYASSVPGAASLWYALEFLAISAAMGYAAVTWWNRAEAERMRDPMVFPFLWNVYYVGLALLTGAFASGVVMATYFRGSATSTPFIVCWGIFAVISWFVWRAVHLWIGKTTLHWGPGMR